MSNTVLRERSPFPGVTLQLVKGDITQEIVDAIINAANAQLQHGGGVAGTISRRGGPQIQAESNAWVRKHGPVSHEHPAYTTGGNLPARYVIHAVGPIWGQGREDEKLAAAVRGSLETARELGLVSLALPAISTGIYGFPKDRAAQVILDAIAAYFSQAEPTSLRLVRIVLYDQATLEVFLGAWAENDGG